MKKKKYKKQSKIWFIRRLLNIRIYIINIYTHTHQIRRELAWKHYNFSNTHDVFFSYVII